MIFALGSETRTTAMALVLAPLLALRGLALGLLVGRLAHGQELRLVEGLGGHEERAARVVDARVHLEVLAVLGRPVRLEEVVRGVLAALEHLEDDELAVGVPPVVRDLDYLALLDIGLEGLLGVELVLQPALVEHGLPVPEGMLLVDVLDAVHAVVEALVPPLVELLRDQHAVAQVHGHGELAALGSTGGLLLPVPGQVARDAAHLRCAPDVRPLHEGLEEPPHALGGALLIVVHGLPLPRGLLLGLVHPALQRRSDVVPRWRTGQQPACSLQSYGWALT